MNTIIAIIFSLFILTMFLLGIALCKMISDSDKPHRGTKKDGNEH